MSLFGLIGYPLLHSWSEGFFNEKFSGESPVKNKYRVFPLENIGEFQGLLQDHPDLTGLNVTIPYKVKILPFLDELDPVAKETGAVNTILISRAGDRVHLKGFNTDVTGFTGSADFTGYSSALLLGTGGAARAVAYSLRHLGIPFQFVSRNPRQGVAIGYDEITGKEMEENRLIINATPLGMFPDAGSCPPLPYEYLTPGHFLYDLVYNPPLTEFLRHGDRAGARIMNGMKMLHLQAESSWEIWNMQT